MTFLDAAEYWAPLTGSKSDEDGDGLVKEAMDATERPSSEREFISRAQSDARVCHRKCFSLFPPVHRVQIHKNENDAKM